MNKINQCQYRQIDVFVHSARKERLTEEYKLKILLNVERQVCHPLDVEMYLPSMEMRVEGMAQAYACDIIDLQSKEKIELNQCITKKKNFLVESTKSKTEYKYEM